MQVIVGAEARILVGEIEIGIATDTIRRDVDPVKARKILTGGGGIVGVRARHRARPQEEGIQVVGAGQEVAETIDGEEDLGLHRIHGQGQGQGQGLVRYLDLDQGRFPDQDLVRDFRGEVEIGMVVAEDGLVR